MEHNKSFNTDNKSYAVFVHALRTFLYKNGYAFVAGLLRVRPLEGTQHEAG